MEGRERARNVERRWCDASVARENAVKGAGMLSSSNFVGGMGACSSSPPYLNTDCPQSAVGVARCRMGCIESNVKCKIKYKAQEQNEMHTRERRMTKVVEMTASDKVWQLQ